MAINVSDYTSKGYKAEYDSQGNVTRLYKETTDVYLATDTQFREKTFISHDISISGGIINQEKTYNLRGYNRDGREVKPDTEKYYTPSGQLDRSIRFDYTHGGALQGKDEIKHLQGIRKTKDFTDSNPRIAREIQQDRGAQNQTEVKSFSVKGTLQNRQGNNNNNSNNQRTATATKTPTSGTEVITASFSEPSFKDTLKSNIMGTIDVVKGGYKEGKNQAISAVKAGTKKTISAFHTITGNYFKPGTVTRTATLSGKVDKNKYTYVPSNKDLIGVWATEGGESAKELATTGLNTPPVQVITYDTGEQRIAGTDYVITPANKDIPSESPSTFNKHQADIGKQIGQVMGFPVRVASSLIPNKDKPKTSITLINPEGFKEVDTKTYKDSYSFTDALKTSKKSLSNQLTDAEKRGDEPEIFFTKAKLYGVNFAGGALKKAQDKPSNTLAIYGASYYVGGKIAMPLVSGMGTTTGRVLIKGTAKGMLGVTGVLEYYNYKTSKDKEQYFQDLGGRAVYYTSAYVGLKTGMKDAINQNINNQKITTEDKTETKQIKLKKGKTEDVINFEKEVKIDGRKRFEVVGEGRGNKAPTKNNDLFIEKIDTVAEIKDVQTGKTYQTTGRYAGQYRLTSDGFKAEGLGKEGVKLGDKVIYSGTYSQTTGKDLGRDFTQINTVTNLIDKQTVKADDLFKYKFQVVGEPKNYPVDSIGYGISQRTATTTNLDRELDLFIYGGRTISNPDLTPPKIDTTIPGARQIALNNINTQTTGGGSLLQQTGTLQQQTGQSIISSIKGILGAEKTPQVSLTAPSSDLIQLQKTKTKNKTSTAPNYKSKISQNEIVLTATKEKYEPKQPTATGTILDTETDLKPVTGVKPGTISITQSKGKSGTIPVLTVTPVTETATKQTPTVTPIVITTPVTRTPTTTITPRTPRITTPTPPPPTPGLGVPFIPKGRSFRTKFKSVFKRLKQPKALTPTGTSAITGQFGKTSKLSIKTGIGNRLIPLSLKPKAKPKAKKKTKKKKRKARGKK